MSSKPALPTKVWYQRELQIVGRKGFEWRPTMFSADVVEWRYDSVLVTDLSGKLETVNTEHGRNVWLVRLEEIVRMK